MSFFNALPTKVTVPVGGGAGQLVGNTWLRNKQLSDLAAIPMGATYALFEFSSGINGTSFGAQKSGDLTDATTTAYARATQYRFIEINQTGTVDLFVSNTAATYGTISLLGYTDYITPLVTPADIGAVFAGANTYTADVSAIVPSQAAGGFLLVELSAPLKYAASGTVTQQNSYSIAAKTHVIIPISQARTFVGYSGTSYQASWVRVLGWLPPDVYITPRQPNEFIDRKLTVLSTYRQIDFSSMTCMDDWRVGLGSGSIIRGIRSAGDTNYTDVTKNTYFSYVWQAPNANGYIDGYTNNLTIPFTWFGGFIKSLSTVKIVSITGLVAGGVATIVFDANFTPVQLKLFGLYNKKLIISSFSGSGTTWTFTVPDLVDETVGMALGAVLASAFDATSSTPLFSTTYTKTGWTSIIVEDTQTDNIITLAGGVVSADDQIVFEPAKGSVNRNAVHTGTWEGTQTIWHYSIIDSKWRSFLYRTSAIRTIDLTGLAPNSTSPKFDGAYILGNRP